MARRARTIKPEILEDSKTATLSHLEYRVFTGTWLIADDYGNLRGEPDFLRGQLVWASSETAASVAHAVGVLADRGLLVPYQVRGQSYLHIAGWAKHQRIDRPSRPTMPGPEHADLRSERGHTTSIEHQRFLAIGSTTSTKFHSSQPSDLILASDSLLSRETLDPEGEGEGEGDQDPPVVPHSGDQTESQQLAEFKAKVDSVLSPAAEVQQRVDAIAAAPNKRRRRERSTAQAMPTGWHPRSEELAKARELGIDAAHEAEQFRDHHAARGTTFRDWDAAFRTWLRNARKFAARSGAVVGGQPKQKRFAVVSDEPDFSRVDAMLNGAK